MPLLPSEVPYLDMLICDAFFLKAICYGHGLFSPNDVTFKDERSPPLSSSCLFCCRFCYIPRKSEQMIEILKNDDGAKGPSFPKWSPYLAVLYFIFEYLRQLFMF